MPHKAAMWPMVITVAVLLLWGAAQARAAASFADETLRYVVTYKWGLITKDTGDATVRLRNRGDRYEVTLAGSTRPWADRLYRVRDTLHAVIATEGFRPLRYAKAAHEGKTISIDDIVYSYGEGSVVRATCNRDRTGNDGARSQTVKELRSTGPTYDMLSVFYYLRLLPYADLKPGSAFKLTMFSGLAAEQVLVKMVGRETITLRDKSKHDTWHVTFTFSTDGGRSKSSDDIDAWLSTDASHIPLLLEGRLKVGRITCHYQHDRKN